MFGLGFSEIVLVVVIMFLITKPEDLPQIFRQIGRIYGMVQRMYYAFLDEINSLDVK